MKRHEAETTILNEISLFYSIEAVENIIAKVRPEHFGDESHRTTYIRYCEEYKRDGRIRFTGAVAYEAHDTPERAIEVLDRELRRELIARYCEKAIEHLSKDTEPDKVLRALSNRLDMISTQAQGEPKPLKYHIEDLIADLKKPNAQVVSVGISDFDNKLGGFKAGQMIVVAARPGMGKSVFASQVAVNNASKGIPVLFMSLEMSGVEIASRIVSGQLGISSTALQERRLTEADWRVLDVASAQLNIPMHIHDRADMDISALRATIRKYVRTYNVGLVVVDYLGLINEPKEGNENREQQVARMSRFFKTEAKEQGIPIMVLAQLNREMEKRATKMPILADLRESGTIEQDADTVIFLHRPEIVGLENMPDNSSSAGKIIINVAKRRSGTTGFVVAHFNGDRQIINNLERDNGSW
jgi:replicative DNA helicase